ncbi:hypothetical protein KI387_027939, partial [Taxus chinensis]
KYLTANYAQSGSCTNLKIIGSSNLIPAGERVQTRFLKVKTVWYTILWQRRWETWCSLLSSVWIFVGLSVVAFALETCVKARSNVSECIELLEEIVLLAKDLNEFKRAMPAESEKLLKAIHVIVEGSVMCCDYIQKGQLSRAETKFYFSGFVSNIITCFNSDEGAEQEQREKKGNKTTPLLVAFTATDKLVRDAAKLQISSNYHNIVFDVKRIIGRKFMDVSLQLDTKLWPFTVVSVNNEKPMIEVAYKGQKKLFTTDEISSMVLAKMKMIVEKHLKSDVKDAFIIVPSYFDEA